MLVWAFGSGGKSPEAAVETYFHALENNDCAAMMDVISEETWRISGATTKSEAIEMCEETFGMAGLDVTLDVKEVRLVSESGDTAVVQATVVVTAGDSTPPVTSTTQYTLRKSGGGWVIEHTELLFEEEGAFD